MAINNHAKIRQALADAYAPDIEPPVDCPLTEEELVRWKHYIHLRARKEWTTSDLYNLVNLIRTQSHLLRADAQAPSEPFSETNDKGATVSNPFWATRASLIASAAQLVRSLHLQPQKRIADVKRLMPQRELEQSAREAREAREAAGEIAGGYEDDDDLLARPPAGGVQ